MRLLTLTIGVACPSNPPPSNGDNASHKIATPPATEKKKQEETKSHAFDAMGTRFQINVFFDETHRPTASLLARLESRTHEIESRISEWKPTSELSVLTRENTLISPSADTLRTVSRALEIAKLSDGAFEPTWAALHGLYDFRPSHLRLPTRQERKRQLAKVDFHQVEIEKSTIRIRQKGVRLGTGGVGKGYALDEIAKELRKQGFPRFLLYAGGQVQVGLPKKGRDGYNVGLRHPRSKQLFGHVSIKSASVSTSGDYERYAFDEQGRFWHHIIDPKTGKPVSHTMATTVVTKRGIDADATSTALFVAGSSKASQVLRKIDPSAAAILIDKDCNVYRFGSPRHATVVFYPEAILKGTPPRLKQCPSPSRALIH